MRRFIFSVLFLAVGPQAIADDLASASKAARDLNAESLRMLKLDLRSVSWLVNIAQTEIVTSYYDFDDLGREGNAPYIDALVREGYVRTRAITPSDDPHLFAHPNAPSKYLSITPTEKGCAVLRGIYGQKVQLPTCAKAAP